MQLSNVLYKISLIEVSGQAHVEIADVVFDSRLVRKGSLFVAVEGEQADGHNFIPQAIGAGAAAIIYQNGHYEPEYTTLIKVSDSRAALAIAAANFYGNPAQKLKVVGITGTNGKTTCATLLYQMFRKLGYNTGLISTVHNLINDQVVPATHTTPNPVVLQQLLAQMLKQGVTHVFMEVSSHALDQKRTDGIEFAGAGFTNITHDHLDYHKTFDNYIAAKKRLFDGLPQKAFAVVNADDKRGPVMLQNTKAQKFTYSLQRPADYQARILEMGIEAMQLQIRNENIWFSLTGKFNASNLLLIAAIAEQLGIHLTDALTVLSGVRGAKGRMQVIKSEAGIIAVVDYAHTPDALLNVLQTLNSLRSGAEQLITVVGCGGNRDKEKRPEMARIATENSQKVVFTSDNPRSEKPENILRDMMAGVPEHLLKTTTQIVDRAQAIAAAIAMADPGDVVLVAGKGHENYQEIDGTKLPFDDAEQIQKIFDKTL